MIRRRLIAIAAVAGAILGSISLFPAAAWASTCDTEFGGNFAVTTCTGTPIQTYRVVATCYDPVHDSNSKAYGEYELTPHRSSVTCAAGHGNVTKAVVQFK